MSDFVQTYKCLSEGFKYKLLLALILAIGQAIAEVFLLVTLVAVLQILARFNSSAYPIDDFKLEGVLNNLGVGTEIEVAISFLVAIGLACGFRLAVIYWNNVLVAHLSQSLSGRILGNLLNSSYIKVLNYSNSLLVASVTKKVDVTVGLFLVPVVLIVNNMVSLLAIVGSLLIVDFESTVIILSTLVLAYGILLKLCQTKILNDGHNVSKGAEATVSYVENTLKSLREIFLYESSELVTREFNILQKKYQEAQARIQIFAAIPRPIIEAVALVIISVSGISMLAAENARIELILPAYGAILFGLQRILPLAQQVYSNYAVIRGSVQTATDLRNILTSSASTSHKLDVVNTSWPLYNIQLDSVCFSFGSKSNLLHNISFEILDAHKFIGLIGPSGIGKSTLVDLMMGLLEPTSGSIVISGKRLSKENRRSWMKRIAHVPQVTHLISGTIAENIVFQSGKMNRERVLKCLELTLLSEVVRNLEEGIDTQIGVGGRVLSGGQKQRISLARALYRDFDFLVLDEAFNGLDDAAIDKILSNLTMYLMPHQKIILISHSAAHLTKVDLMLQLDSDGIKVENRPAQI